MIIKTLRWHHAGFQKLANYVGREMGREKAITVFHNLWYSKDLSQIAGQFIENDAYRKKRVRGTAIYHEILSFHSLDSVVLTPEVLEDLTNQYLSIRAPKGIAFASSHFDKEHVHVHIMIGGCELKSAKTLRMSNERFTRLRRKIEHFQIKNYPELQRSIVHLNKDARSKALLREMEKDRQGIQQAYEEANSLQEYYNSVESLNIDHSNYTIVNTGRIDYGIDTSELEKVEGRINELNRVNDDNREKKKDVSRGRNE